MTGYKFNVINQTINNYVIDYGECNDYTDLLGVKS